jgi:hypothetical protein
MRTLLASLALLFLTAGMPCKSNHLPVEHMPQLQSAGGPVMNPVEIVTIAPSNFFTKNDRDTMFEFGDALVASKWLQEVTRDYTKGKPVATHRRITGVPFGPFKTPPPISTIDAYVAAEIQLHPDPAKLKHHLYVVLIPPGSQVNGDDNEMHGGFHHKFLNSLDDAWAVIQPAAKPGIMTFVLDEYTTIIAHEVVEAITDNGQIGFKLRRDRSVDVRQQTPHVAGSTEVGDLCHGARIVEGKFLFQRTYTNHRAASGFDPCTPAATTEFFSTSPAGGNSWTVTHGGTATIHLRGWTESGRCMTWHVRVAPRQPGGSDGVKLAVSPKHFDISTGQEKTIHVTVPSPGNKAKWGAVVVTSFIDNPPRGADEERQWWYGVFYEPVSH